MEEQKLFNGERILIVDDEPMIRDLLTAEFNYHGALTFEASNGLEALELATKHDFLVVISDIRMPKGDGVTLLDHLRKKSATKPLIVMMSGFSDHKFEDIYEKGAAAVFSKPFEVSMIVEAISRLLKKPEEKWVRQHERIDCKQEITVSVSFNDSKTASLGPTINIGQGGMFVKMNSPRPPVGTLVKFKILLNNGQPSLIDGTAIVRWCRDESLPQVPSGIGLEFLDLSVSATQQIIELIQQLKPLAYIPKA